MISYVENATVKSNWHVFFIMNRYKFTVVINKRTLPCKEVIKEFSLFLKVLDKLAIV